MVAANRGAQPGWLVPLSAGLCYIGKGGCFLGCSSIAKVLLHRTGAGSSTFDVTVMRRRGGRNAGGAGDVPAPLELGQIGAAELAHLQEYLQRQRIRVRARGVPAVACTCSQQCVMWRRAVRCVEC